MSSNDLKITAKLPPYIYSHRSHQLNPSFRILLVPSTLVPRLCRNLHTVVVDILIRTLRSVPRFVFPFRFPKDRVLAAVVLAANLLVAGAEAVAEREEPMNATQSSELAGEDIAIGGKTSSNDREIGFDVCPDGAFASGIWKRDIDQ